MAVACRHERAEAVPPRPPRAHHRRGQGHRCRPGRTTPRPGRPRRAGGPGTRPPRRHRRTGGRRRGGPATSPTAGRSTRWSRPRSTQLGGLDVVVANAGVAAQLPLVGGDPAIFEQTLRVNVLGTYYTLRAAGPHISHARATRWRSPRSAARSTCRSSGAYSASKAAVEALGNMLRQEVRGAGARVGVAYFAELDTDMTSRGFGTEAAGRGARRARPSPASRRSGRHRRAGAGITRRSRRIVAPWWVAGVLPIRSWPSEWSRSPRAATSTRRCASPGRSRSGSRRRNPTPGDRSTEPEPEPEVLGVTGRRVGQRPRVLASVRGTGATSASWAGPSRRLGSGRRLGAAQPVPHARAGTGPCSAAGSGSPAG